METNMVPNTQVRDLYRLEDLLWSLIQNLNAKKKNYIKLNTKKHSQYEYLQQNSRLYIRNKNKS